MWSVSAFMVLQSSVPAFSFFPAQYFAGLQSDMAKAVNREDKRSRRYRDRDFAKFERSRRYRDR